MAEHVDWTQAPEEGDVVADAFAEAAGSNLGLPLLLVSRALNLAFNDDETDSAPSERHVTRDDIDAALQRVAYRFNAGEYTGY
jgi:hypothetical protein